MMGSIILGFLQVCLVLTQKIFDGKLCFSDFPAKLHVRFQHGQCQGEDDIHSCAESLKGCFLESVKTTGLPLYYASFHFQFHFLFI